MMLRHPPFNAQACDIQEEKGTMNRHQITSMTGRKHGPKINARGVHATGSDPSDLGMMQIEGRPQRSKLKTQAKGINAAGTDPRGLGMMQP